MTTIRAFIKSLDYVFVLLISLVINSIISRPSFAEASIIAILAGYQGFKFFINETRTKPINDEVKKQLVELNNRISRIESKDNLERMAANTAQVQTTKRLF